MLISELTTEMINEGLKIIDEFRGKRTEFVDVAAFASTPEDADNGDTTLFNETELEAELKRRNNASIHTS